MLGMTEGSISGLRSLRLILQAPGDTRLLPVGNAIGIGITHLP